MHFLIFGLSISSSWGNGHATLWRGLLKAMARRGHTVTFYERDVPYYASTRDGWDPPKGVRLRLYESLEGVRRDVEDELRVVDVAMCTSYCSDGAAASRLVLNAPSAVRAFYDLDTPVTLDTLHANKAVDYLPEDGLQDFDLVLSYTGGRALEELQSKLGARFVAPLYGSVDPETHMPAAAMDEFRSSLCYLGTYAADRQPALAELFIKPAEKMPDLRFALGGAQYPADFPWTENIFFVRHLPPSLHPAFFCSSRATLNITRRAMAEYGYCPSGRLFEAAACGTPILTDWWEGLEAFFTPGEQILRVDSTQDVIDALELSDIELLRVRDAARERALQEHTAEHRVMELERICEQAKHGGASLAMTA
ncbi:MAG: glycosyltransferase [Acidobacteria bacterium]|nr:glycosyltransferase [Acidobacteriota bacterium]